MKSLQVFKLQTFNHSNRPSLQAGVYYFILILFSVSCSTFRIPIKSSKGGPIAKNAYSEMTERDYKDHLASLKTPFISTPGIKTITQDQASKKYLETLVNEIIANNEIFFKELKSANITILNTDSPLHFSLPKGELFISRGLISKYIKHESMLVGIFSFELVRSEKLLYPKQTIIPIGYIPLERMLYLNRLELEEKMEIHKWAHYLTVRSGYDGEYYLSWLQTQNRNTADFILQVGDANQINREEALFKAFLIKNASVDDVLAKKNSSKSFYSFINSIRDGVL